MAPHLRWSGRKRSKREEARALRALFHNFRRILEHNTLALEVMTDLERALSGEYIFDKSFLERSVRDLGLIVQRVVSRLNTLADDRYAELFDRYQAVRDQLEDVLAGGPEGDAAPQVMPFAEIGWESEPAVGTEAASLAELGARFDLPASDGFVVTVAGVRRLLAQEDWPRDLEDRIREEGEALLRRSRRAGSLSVAAHRLDAAGRVCADFVAPDGKFVRRAGELPAAVRAVLAQCRDEAGSGDPPHVTVSVREAPAAVVSGVVRTLVREPGRDDALLVEARRDARDGTERYRMRRSYPFRILRAEPLRGDMPRGPLSADRLAKLAETCMAVERVQNAPQKIGWLFDARGGLLLTTVRPQDAAGADRDAAGELERTLAGAEVLAKGGFVAQGGVGAGRVVHVVAGAAPEEFPLGAVAVARVAAPALSPILRRAAALVTEVGTPVGHLAILAREFRVPAIFGLPGALAALPQGTDVTVDATEQAVYRGVLEPLLRARSAGPELDPGDPEYAALRRILRLVRPLGLLDPESPDFTPAGCRTFHDILHFAHEKAVEELSQLGERRSDLSGALSRRLRLAVPLDIRVLDIGEGVSEAAAARPRAVLEAADLRCAPLLAFLRGLADSRAWSSRPAAIGLGDVVGSMGKTLSLLADSSGVATMNLAIAAREYLNLSLRLGYHFSVIDAHLTDNPNQNAIYFRFVGGLADEERRRRRAGLIRVVLEGLGFLVEMKGDLVIGKLKVADRPDMEAALARLGQLTAFTRQMDTAMQSDADAAEQARIFLRLPPAPPAAWEIRP